MIAGNTAMRRLILVGLAIGVIALFTIPVVIPSWPSPGISPLIKGIGGDVSVSGTYGGGDPPYAPKTTWLSREVFQLTLSGLLLAASLFVILSAKYGPKDKHWAYATVGTLVGFWLH
jgi:hypothetical protein